MRGDVTRQTFRSGDHYRSVLQQQGRVQLDADWNEQSEIQAYLDRTVAADVVGASGAPHGNAGMEITLDGAGQLQVGPGHYYVDGILCENDATMPLADQPDLPGVALPDGDGVASYVAYLDVWFEHITMLENPRLQEVALGGPDTTTRARTIWQVRLRKVDDPEPANPKAFLLARAVAPTGAAATPCVVGPAAGYQRLENQLYRIEVFNPSRNPDGTPSTPTFLWSRENGSVIAAVTDIRVVPDAEAQQDTVLLTIAAQGRDDRLAFHPKDWVEVTDRGRIRRGERGVLAQLVKVEGTTLTFWVPHVKESEKQPVETIDRMVHPVVRRWDSTDETLQQPFVIPQDETPVAIEDGVQVTFEKGGVYRTGDYWLIPARTANLEGERPVSDLAGNVEWPRDKDGNALFQPPDGVCHHFADIAHLTRAGGAWRLDSDDRQIFSSLTELTALATLPDVDPAGGDGQESLPGVALDEPLRVAVTRNLRPVKGATVRFTTADDDALLVSPDPNAGGAGVPHQVDVETDDAGIASCGWQLAPTGRPSQQVIAQLLDAAGAPTGPVLGFTASLSLADRVAFDPEGCVPMDGVTTVQAALTRLADAPVLVPVAGNGQIATAGADLPVPVEVLVSGGCGGPVPNVMVRFATAEGRVRENAGDPPAPSMDLATGADGRARCRWQLGRDVPLQTLTATLLAGPDPDRRAAPVTFLAGVAPPTLTVDRVELTGPGTALTDGALVVTDDLASGLAAVLDGAPDDAVAGSPALTVTLDLPFPFSASDRDLWTDTVAGSVPLSLGGDVAVADVAGAPAVSWTPDDGAVTFLQGLFARMQAGHRGDTLRGRVRLASSVLGAGARDVDLWFRLVGQRTTLVLVPHRAGRLQLASSQRAIALSVPRDALRAALPADVVVADVQPDHDGAARAATRIFPAGVEPRALRLVVDARYHDAGAAIQNGLNSVGVQLELLDAADPAADATTRLGADETVDGVLTDGASAGPVLAVVGFTTEVPL